MDKIYIIYWSHSGNTQQMAEAVAAGVKEAGKEAVLLSPQEANVADIADVEAFAMGCPAMGDEVLEEIEMEPFVEEIKSIVSGKTIALFGSYGWGDGQWMRDWTDRMQAAGAKVIGGIEAISLDAPGIEEVAICSELGKTLAGI